MPPLEKGKGSPHVHAHADVKMGKQFIFDLHHHCAKHGSICLLLLIVA